MPEHPEHVNKFNMLFPNIDCKTYSRQDVVNFYKNIDVYLIPDRRAGGPMSALEAGAMNIPLITTNCGLLGDMFVDKEHGILIDTYDQFVAAIQ